MVVNTSNARISKIINLGIVLFTVYPFIFLAYMYLVSGGDVINHITKNISVTVSFISTMLMPFIASILRNFDVLMQKDKEQTCFIKLIVLLVSQVILLNIPACVILGLIIYRFCEKFSFGVKESLVYFKKNFTEFIGVLLVFVLSTGITFISMGIF